MKLNRMLMASALALLGSSTFAVVPSPSTSTGTEANAASDTDNRAAAACSEQSEGDKSLCRDQSQMSPATPSQSIGESAAGTESSTSQRDLPAAK